MQIFLLALFLAYLVMAAQFNSWRYPIYLLLPVPLALVGALWLVFVIGGGLDIFGLMGMLMLIGLSAKNAILYLDFVVERINRMPLHEALLEAAKLRFRPIIMTTLTVLVISFPLIFGSGQGAEFGQRMGIVMLGGIVFSALTTVLGFASLGVASLLPVRELGVYGATGIAIALLVSLTVTPTLVQVVKLPPRHTSALRREALRVLSFIPAAISASPRRSRNGAYQAGCKSSRPARSSNSSQPFSFRR
jgi:multidrug efflux pump subunit AcrB